MFGGDAKDIRQAMSSNPSATGKSFFTIDPRRCALIVIDMQNAFVAEGAVFETPGARAMIPRLEHLIQFARATRIPIVWTQSDHRPPYEIGRASCRERVYISVQGGALQKK